MGFAEFLDDLGIELHRPRTSERLSFGAVFMKNKAYLAVGEEENLWRSGLFPIRGNPDRPAASQHFTFLDHLSSIVVCLTAFGADPTKPKRGAMKKRICAQRKVNAKAAVPKKLTGYKGKLTTLIGIFASEVSDLAARHDDYLYNWKKPG